jgi:hypothetical protein
MKREDFWDVTPFSLVAWYATNVSEEPVFSIFRIPEAKRQ